MWQQYYKFPLKRRYSKVFTDDFNMAFDFSNEIIYPNCYKFEQDQMDEIIAKINGDKILMCYSHLRYNPDDTTIYINQNGVDKVFIVIRGWGNLTGPGGHNLLNEKAVKIQDAFANYIVEKLSYFE